MIIRWQMGPFGKVSWKALETSIRLMKRMEPEARLIVTHQAGVPNRIHKDLLDVQWHAQDAMLYPIGRHMPPRFNIDDHEVWMDNDHIMWDLPMGWNRFKSRRNAVLIWRTDWSYYGDFDESIHMTMGKGFDASAGMWGLPPNREWSVPKHLMARSDANQHEMGWVVDQLTHGSWQEYIYEDQVSCFNPDHPVLGSRKNIVGTHGVHLMGLNRGFNPQGEELLEKIRREHL